MPYYLYSHMPRKRNPSSANDKEHPLIDRVSTEGDPQLAFDLYVGTNVGHVSSPKSDAGPRFHSLLEHEGEEPAKSGAESSAMGVEPAAATGKRKGTENLLDLMEGDGDSSANNTTSLSLHQIGNVSFTYPCVDQVSRYREMKYDGEKTVSHDFNGTDDSYRQGEEQLPLNSQESVTVDGVNTFLTQDTGITVSQYVSAFASNSTSPRLSPVALGALVSATPLVSNRAASCERAGSQVSVVLSPLSRPLSLALETPSSTCISVRGSSTRSSAPPQHLSRMSNSPTTYQQHFPLTRSRDEARELTVSTFTWNSSGVLDGGKEHGTSSMHSVDSLACIQQQRSLSTHARVGSGESDIFPHPSESMDSDIRVEKGRDPSLKGNLASLNRSSPRDTQPLLDDVKAPSAPPVQIMHRPPTVPNRTLKRNYEDVALSSGGEGSDDFYEDFNDFADDGEGSGDDFGEPDSRFQSHHSMQHRQRLFAPLMSRWRTSRRCASRSSYKRSKRLAGGSSAAGDGWNLAERLEQLEQIRVTNFEALEERKQHQQNQQSAATGTGDARAEKHKPRRAPHATSGSGSSTNDDCTAYSPASMSPNVEKSKRSRTVAEVDLTITPRVGNQTGRSLRSLSTPSSSRTLDNNIVKESGKVSSDGERAACEPTGELNDVNEYSIVSYCDSSNRGTTGEASPDDDRYNDDHKMLLPALGSIEPEDHLPNSGGSCRRSWGSSKGTRSAPHVLLKRTPRSTTLSYHRTTSVVASLLQKLMVQDSGKISIKLNQSHSTLGLADSKELTSPSKQNEQQKRGRRRQFARWKDRTKNLATVSRKVNNSNGAAAPVVACVKTAGRVPVPASVPLEAPTTTIVSPGAPVTYAATPHVEKSTEKHVPRNTPVHERGKDRRRDGCHFSPSRGESGTKPSQSLTFALVGQATKVGIRLAVSGGCNGNVTTTQSATPMTARPVCGRRYRTTTCSSNFQSSSATAGVLATANKRSSGCFQTTRPRNVAPGGNVAGPSPSSGSGGAAFFPSQATGIGSRTCGKSMQLSVLSCMEQHQATTRAGPREVSPLSIRGSPSAQS